MADHKRALKNRIVGFVVLLLCSGVAASLAYYYSTVKSLIPRIFVEPIYALIILVGGYIGIWIISAIIQKLVQPQIGLTRGRGLRNFFQIVAVIVLLTSIAALFGFNITAVLIGYGFAAIVLGLAAQQVLGNIFAGISLFISRPFEIGDRVTMNMPQYGIIGPTYTHEAIVPGYTGVIVDIGIFFTSVLLDDGSPVVLPNSAMLGAMVFNHTKAENRLVRVRVDLDKQIEFDDFKRELSNVIKRQDQGSRIDKKKLSVEITDVGTETYQVSIFAWTLDKFDEPVKSFLIKSALDIQKKLDPVKKQGDSEGSS